MKEVEVKVRDIDKEKIIEKIEKLGARKVFSGKVIDFRYDTPDRMLSRQGKAFRIRQKGKYFYIHMKGKKKSIEQITGRDEIGVKISNSRIMNKILIELGYIKIFELSKYRTEYRLDDINFDIDEYIGMPPILEIESDSYDKVNTYLKKLNLNEKQLGRVYIREILAARRKFDEERAKKRNEMNK